jgi:polyphosphate kinase
MSLVVRNEGKRKQSYAHFGTGNYHPVTAKVYTDLSFFTCDPDLCNDMARIFNYMTGYAVPQNMHGVAIAPLNLRSTLYGLIDNEIAAAKKGKPSGIWIKINNLIDPDMIRRFYAASQAGVPIELIIRGICTLRPGIPGLSENIQVKSIVGRFLEHSRIYCFANGDKLPSRKAKVFISSADLMPRNLDFRIETLVPIENETVHEQILEQVMVANLKDVKQSWAMDSEGKYTREKSKSDDFSVHDYFMHNPSLSGRGAAISIGHDAPPKLAYKRTRVKDSTSA